MTTTDNGPGRRATRDTLERIWSLLALHMLATLESGEPMRASMLAVITKFLVANGITAEKLRAQHQHAEHLRALSQEFGAVEIDDDGKVVKLPVTPQTP